jgi:hypothetical protein
MSIAKRKFLNILQDIYPVNSNHMLGSAKAVLRVLEHWEEIESFYETKPLGLRTPKTHPRIPRKLSNWDQIPLTVHLKGTTGMSFQTLPQSSSRVTKAALLPRVRGCLEPGLLAISTWCHTPFEIWNFILWCPPRNITTTKIRWALVWPTSSNYFMTSSKNCSIPHDIFYKPTWQFLEALEHRKTWVNTLYTCHDRKLN